MAMIVVREIATSEVVREIDVTGKTESQIERVEMGVLRQMDRERYYTEVQD